MTELTEDDFGLIHSAIAYLGAYAPDYVTLQRVAALRDKLIVMQLEREAKGSAVYDGGAYP